MTPCGILHGRRAPPIRLVYLLRVVLMILWQPINVMVAGEGLSLDVVHTLRDALVGCIACIAGKLDHTHSLHRKRA